MLDKNNAKMAILEAINRGYTVDKKGNVISPTNNLLSTEGTRNLNGIHYKMFAITLKNKKRTNIKVHRLVAYLKYGDVIFEKGIVVRHINGDHKDNSWDNILIGTYSENMMDKPKNIRMNAAIKATSFCRKYSKDFLEKLFKDRFENNMTYKSLTSKYDIGKSTLSFLFNKSIFSKEYFGRVAPTGRASALHAEG